MKQSRIVCFLLLVICFLFYGCKKDKDDGKSNKGIKKLEVSVENGADYLIDKVKLICYGYERSLVLATADYNNGKITFNLPEIVDPWHLFEVGDDWYSNVTVSNPNAQIAGIEIAGYKDNRQVGWIRYEKEDEEKGVQTNGSLIYVNSDLSINGAGIEVYDEDITYIEEYNYSFSVNAKRGWNILYWIGGPYTETETLAGIKQTYKEELTTSDPGGLKWNVYYEEDNYYGIITAGDELKINAQVENGHLYNNIRRVRANGLYYALAVGSYNNGSFSLTVPNAIYNSNLTFIDNVFYNSNISNSDARITLLRRIRGYSSSSGEWYWDHYVGDFVYGKIETNSTTMAMYLFSNIDVNVTGTGYYNYSNYDYYDFNMNLKAGWNIIYITNTLSGNNTITTDAVSNLKWYFEDDFIKTAPFSIKRRTKNSFNSIGFKSKNF